jgi:hypothetical protein
MIVIVIRPSGNIIKYDDAYFDTFYSEFMSNRPERAIVTEGDDIITIVSDYKIHVVNKNNPKAFNAVKEFIRKYYENIKYSVSVYYVDRLLAEAAQSRNSNRMWD